MLVNRLWSRFVSLFHSFAAVSLSVLICKAESGEAIPKISSSMNFA